MAPPVSFLALHDDALPAAHFARLWRRIRALGREHEKDGWWTTFWFDLGTPTNAVEEAVLALKARHLPALEVAGVEWWIGRMSTRDVALDPHADRDNARFARTGRTVHPHTSSVLYFNRVKGGSLLVTDQRAHGEGFRPAEPRAWAVARPQPNRFVHFDGWRVHAVLDANDALPTRRIPGPRGRLRTSLVVNWWPKRPEGVEPWSPATYAPLRLARG